MNVCLWINFLFVCSMNVCVCVRARACNSGVIAKLMHLWLCFCSCTVCIIWRYLCKNVNSKQAHICKQAHIIHNDYIVGKNNDKTPYFLIFFSSDSVSSGLERISAVSSGSFTNVPFMYRIFHSAPSWTWRTWRFSVSFACCGAPSLRVDTPVARGEWFLPPPARSGDSRLSLRRSDAPKMRGLLLLSCGTFVSCADPTRRAEAPERYKASFCCFCFVFVISWSFCSLLSLSFLPVLDLCVSFVIQRRVSLDDIFVTPFSGEAARRTDEEGDLSSAKWMGWLTFGSGIKSRWFWWSAGDAKGLCNLYSWNEDIDVRKKWLEIVLVSFQWDSLTKASHRNIWRDQSLYATT